MVKTPKYFNPQGPRGPRHEETAAIAQDIFISIHKALAGLDPLMVFLALSGTISIHKALAGLDRSALYLGYLAYISIHKALAGLDGLFRECAGGRENFNPQGPRGPRQQNYPTIPPHPPNFLCIMSSPPYFNLLHPFTQPIFTAFPLFFRCESPRHFMLAWHSHLV